MRKEQLTINIATRTIDKMQEFIFGVKGQMSKVKCPRTQGFTLIEMIVSLGLFTIIMFIATSSLLSIVNTDRKARSVRIAADNLNLALEDMSRRIKTGSTYYCGEYPSGTLDCSAPAPASAFSFDDQTSSSTNRVRVTYKWAQGSACSSAYSATQGCILREGSSITSPEINITGLNFIVSGSAPCGTTPCGSTAGTDAVQPSVLILVDGALPSVPGMASTTFKIQTLVTQRIYDN